MTPIELHAHSLSFGDASPLYAPDSSQRYWGFQENAMFDAVLRRLRPRLALEVGSFLGLRLSAMSRYSQKVISLDVDATIPTRLGPLFPNVEFITGDSGLELPRLMQRLRAEQAPLDFAFVDADHAYAAVRADAQCFLDAPPSGPLHVFFHDTFNPECRQGILDAGWADCPFCHYLELDYVVGILHPDPAIRNTMWGGLGLAILKPEKRERPLEIRETLRGMFDACRKASVYA
jgi:hypothetical protein